jgi:hypothetical protein
LPCNIRRIRRLPPLKQLLFSRDRTLAPGGHPSAGITVTARSDGVIVRITDQSGRWYEVFLDTAATANLVEMLTDDPTVWGWRPAEAVASHGRRNEAPR